MIDVLSSPILFPSDMDTSKLTADPNFKLPEPVNWTDHDYHNTMTDKSMTILTDLIKLEPVKEYDIHVYSPFINNSISPKITSVMNQKANADIPDGGSGDDYTQRLALLALAQSMVYAYTLPIQHPPGDIYKQNGNMNKNDGDGQNVLWTNLRCALDVVENDLQQNGKDSLYSSSQQQIGNVNDSIYYQGRIGDDWSWCEDLTDVPDLVHSIGGSYSSLHSLVDNHQSSQSSSTLVLLESGISSHLDGGDSSQVTDITASDTTSSTLSQQMDGKKKNKIIKNWVVKIKKSTSSLKQDCVKSVSCASRKFCRWVKNQYRLD